jgi:hypothetical protein
MKPFPFLNGIKKLHSFTLENLEYVTEKSILVKLSDLLLDFQRIIDASLIKSVFEKIIKVFDTMDHFKVETAALSLKWNVELDFADTSDQFRDLWSGYDSIDFDFMIPRIIEKCTVDSYKYLLGLHIDKLLSDASAIRNQDENDDTLGCLHTLDIFIKSCLSSWKPDLNHSWSTIIELLGNIVQSSSRLKVVKKCTQICIHVIKTISFELSSSQISLLFLFLESIHGNRKLQPKDPRELFDIIYEMLYCIIRYRREEMLNQIPHYISNISFLVDAFKSISTVFKDDKQFHSHSIYPLSYSSLGSDAAQGISRLLFQMSQKPSINDKEDWMKPFGKHSCFLVIKFLSLPATTKQTMGEEWKRSIFACLDVCDDHGRNMILANLDGSLQSLRPIFKTIVSEWERNHRYHGKA